MWNDLKKHFETVKDRKFIDMVDAERANDFSALAGDMRLDYAKTNIDAEGARAVVQVAG